MQTFLSVYLLAATLTSAVVLLAGWARARAPSHGPSPFAADPAALVTDKTPADIRAAAAVALNRLRPLLACQNSKIDIGIRPGLLVRMSADALTDLLEDLLTAMVRTTPGGSNLLLTAVTRGGQIAIMLSDEAADSDETELRGLFRGLAERVALRGGALDVIAQGAGGSTVILRLASAATQTGPAGLTGATHAGPADAAPSPAVFVS
jgi:hypothetical protein